jgi:hypothetical protein
MESKMKKYLSVIILLIFAVIITAGFIIDNPFGSKTKNKSELKNTYVNTVSKIQSIGLNSPTGTALFTDNFDGANDTTSLKARGYIIYNRSATIGSSSWFQGNINVFPSFNGPTTGYVGANYNAVISAGNIDLWLILPRLTGGTLAGDSLYFYSRSPLNSAFADSIRVMYSVSDSSYTGTWTELGRFKVNTDSSGSFNPWVRKGFRAPVASVNGRFAIRYCVADGGINGSNSDYIGIDALTIERGSVGIQPISTETPSSYSVSQNYPNPFNPTTKINFALPKSGLVTLKVYDMLGKEVATLVNEVKNVGTYSVDFNASTLSSGIYFYKVSVNGFSEVKKMMLIK